MTDSLRKQAADPTSPLASLAEIAHKHPELRATIAANPSTYPDLLDWLAKLDDSEINAAIAGRGRKSDEDQAGDPDTPPEDLAELAYQHPSLRKAIAANPSAYQGLRDWIKEAGDTPATVVATVSAPVATPIIAAPAVPAASKVPLMTRINAHFGETFTFTTALTITLIAFTAVISLVAGSTLANGVSSLVTFGVASISSAIDGSQGQPGDNPSNPGAGTSGDASTGATDGSSGNGMPVVQPVEEPHYIPTVLILDASGSMVRSVPSGGTRMAAARNAAEIFVDGLGEGAQVGLTVFGTSTGNKPSDQAAGCSDVRTIVPVGPVDKEAFKAAIASIGQSGFTPLGPAMQSAADQLSSDTTAQIVLVSDGVETCSPPACEIAANLHAAHPGLTINAVGFAVDADEQAQAQLGCIAAAGGGEYVDAGDAVQLAARLRALSDPVSIAGAVNPRGFNALKLGMSVDQAKAANSSVVLGKVTVDIQYAECDDALLQFKNGRLFDIEPKSSAPTADGLRVGDDASQAVAIYGAPLSSGSDSAGDFAVFPAARGSDSGFRVYYQPESAGAVKGKVIKVVICLCGTGGGSVSEISAWQFSSNGLGPLTLDMSTSDVKSVFSGATEGDTCGVVTLGTSGVGSQTFAFTRSGNDPRNVFAYRVHWDGTTANSAYPTTTLGVGVGSTRDEVLAAYPAATIINDNVRQSIAILTDANGVSLIFGFNDDGIVNDIQVGYNVALVGEPCAF